jgi:hypothetical protein
MPKALVAVGSLLTLGMSVTPAQAAVVHPTVMKTCFRTVDGVTLKVRLSFEMRSASDPATVHLMRVRVSHPDGHGHFRNTTVRSTAATLFFESQGGDPRLGTAVFAERRGDSPVYRKRLNEALSTATAMVTFRLPHGERASMSCSERFPSA